MLVGVAGVVNSGKTTIAELLVKHWGFEQASFAAKLKELALRVNPIAEILYGQENRYRDVVLQLGAEGAKEIPEVRRLFQELGTGVRDILGANTWVDAAVKDLRLDQRYVFSDVRFPNEADAIRDRGGFLLKVTRPGAGLAGAAGLHSSETALQDYAFDWVIDNSGELRDLKREVDEFMLDVQEWPVAG